MSSIGGLDPAYAAAAGAVETADDALIRSWKSNDSGGSALSRWIGKNRTKSGIMIGAGLMVAAALIAAPFTLGFSLAALAPAGAAIGAGIAIGGTVGEFSKASKGKRRNVVKNVLIAFFAVAAVTAAVFFVASTFGVGAGVLGIGAAAAAATGVGTVGTAVGTVGFFATCGLVGAAITGIFSSMFTGKSEAPKTRASFEVGDVNIHNPTHGLGRDLGVDPSASKSSAQHRDAAGGKGVSKPFQGQSRDERAARLGMSSRTRGSVPPATMVSPPRSAPPAQTASASPVSIAVVNVRTQQIVMPDVDNTATALRPAHAERSRSVSPVRRGSSPVRARGLSVSGFGSVVGNSDSPLPPVEDLTK